MTIYKVINPLLKKCLKLPFSFIAICIIALTSCLSQQSNCARFKTGMYSLKLPGGGYSIIERRDAMQLETNSVTKQTLRSKIKWLDDCDYELKYLSQSEQVSDSIISFIQSKVLKVKIITTGKDYYVFEAEMDGISKKYSDTVRVMNKY